MKCIMSVLPRSKLKLDKYGFRIEKTDQCLIFLRYSCSFHGNWKKLVSLDNSFQFLSNEKKYHMKKNETFPNFPILKPQLSWHISFFTKISQSSKFKWFLAKNLRGGSLWPMVYAGHFPRIPCVICGLAAQFLDWKATVMSLNLIKRIAICKRT